MLKNAYNIVTDEVSDIPLENWIQITDPDNIRRCQAIKERCLHKSVLEFGCGNGGFLRQIKETASHVTGIELMDAARERLSMEGFEVYKTLAETKRKYDVVCMFFVIEHLNNPDEILRGIYDVLNPNGIFVCDTANAEDILISKYKCNAFKDFTYWSKHVFLFNSRTLKSLLERNGFQTEVNTRMQRYSLANHLYWLSMGKPGGHTKWTEFNEQELNELYAQKLIECGVADTLWYIGKKYR